ncbi:hypothetical protein MFLAVUS_002803 [Mucor flavus]|uniref:Uncharacterized protein n=1 Tax=Mucor flavus TaxID=439312 RepID=A0ABP9YRA5_9FUNG
MKTSTSLQFHFIMSDYTEKLAQIEQLNGKGTPWQKYRQSVDITDYDRQIVESKDTSKAYVRTFFDNNITTLQDSFPYNQRMIKQLKKLRVQIKQTRNNLYDINFRSNEYPNLKKQLRDKRKLEELAETSGSKRTRAATDNIETKENDRVFVESVGTIIKEAVIKIHEDKFIRNISITSRERSILSNTINYPEYFTKSNPEDLKEAGAFCGV